MHQRYYDTEIGGFYPVLSITEGMFETRSNLAATLGHEVEVHFQQQIVPAGSTPLVRTLQIRSILGPEECHGKESEVQRRIQA